MKMTDRIWAKALLLFEENQGRIVKMAACDATPSARFCRESPHRALGHLTACQAAWLPLMRQLRDGAARGEILINPDPLFTKLGFSAAGWDVLVARFVADRTEWRRVLEQVELQREIQTSKRVYSAQTLTKRMVEHERRHLGELS